jgi:hypothetical protein
MLAAALTLRLFVPALRQGRPMSLAATASLSRKPIALIATPGPAMARDKVRRRAAPPICVDPARSGRADHDDLLRHSGPRHADKRCHGMTAAELGDRGPPFPPSSALPRRDIELVVYYLLAKVIGRGPITREECAETRGERLRSCGEHPAH